MLLPPLPHPRLQLSDTLGHPVLFSLTAVSARTAEMDFATLPDHLHLTDSVLGKQVTVLETAGWVRVRKGCIGKRTRTRPKPTEEGSQCGANTPFALLEIAFPVAPVDP